MNQGSARINVTPSKQNLGMELRAAVANSRGGDFDYNYIYGFRKLSDPLIYFHRESKQWKYPQDVEFVVHGCADEGKCLTFADIKVDQSSTEHEAYIIGGGIGQNHIRILVKVQNTYWLKYEVRMYVRNVLEDIN